ncbi:MAG: glycosyltransferase family A protein [Planctomycetota bacterium]|nr:glycosyltransferase family A protein [Planctomycetota bacterium]
MGVLAVAAVVPVYNRPRVVIEALDSVAAQTRPPDELVVVDDGSSPETARRVAAWIEASNGRLPTRLIRQTNAGPAAARNRGAAEVNGCDLLAFLDSDDLWPQDYLERMTQAFERNPSAAAASCDQLLLDARTEHSELIRRDVAAPRATSRILAEGAPGTPNTVVRTAPFRAAGGYHPKWPLGEEFDLMLRLSQHGEWLYVPGAPVVVRLGRAAAAGEEGHFGKLRPDPRRIEAQLIEEFLTSYVPGRNGGANGGPEPAERRVLAYRWYKAGRQLARLGKRHEGHECFRRALHWRLGYFRAWWGAAATVGFRNGAGGNRAAP